MAGVDPKDVDISIDEDVLTIKGQSRNEHEVSEDRWVRRELRYGNFARMLQIPPSVNGDEAHAEFDNGVLRLTLPKKAEALPRSIKIAPKAVLKSAKPSKT